MPPALDSLEAAGDRRASAHMPVRAPWPAMSTPSDMPVASPIGQDIGSYRLVEFLGGGAMGDVYRAEHVLLGRQVAVKLLHPRFARHRQTVGRFFQEAQVVGRIRHRNIVEVTNLDVLPDGTPYIVMELVVGRELDDWVAEHRGDIRRVVAVFLQICDGLEAAHRVGVVHRDLKPDNILVTRDHNGSDLAKILDFGVAKLVDQDTRERAWRTTGRFVLGTPAYMSPEQARAESVDARSDIYSLGAVMYELLTGQPVFDGETTPGFVHKHQHEAPMAPRGTRGGGDIDPGLERVLLRCLAKDRSDRYTTAAALRGDLERVLAGEVVADGNTTRPIRSAAGPAAPARAPSRDRRRDDRSEPGSRPHDWRTPDAGAHQGAAGSPGHPDSSSDRAVTRLWQPRAATPRLEAATGTQLIESHRGGRSVAARVALSLLPLGLAAAAAAYAFGAWPASERGSTGESAPTGQRGAADHLGAGTAGASPASSAASGVAPGRAPERPAVTRSRAAHEALDDPARPALAVSALEPPTPADRAPQATPITVRIYSTPDAEVYLAGASTAQCVTPCDLTVNRDAGAIIVRKTGYHARQISLDEHRPGETVRIKLRRSSTEDDGERTRRKPRRPDSPPERRAGPDERAAPKTISPGHTLDPYRD